MGRIERSIAVSPVDTVPPVCRFLFFLFPPSSTAPIDFPGRGFLYCRQPPIRAFPSLPFPLIVFSFFESVPCQRAILQDRGVGIATSNAQLFGNSSKRPATSAVPSSTAAGVLFVSAETGDGCSHPLRHLLESPDLLTPPSASFFFTFDLVFPGSSLCFGARRKKFFLTVSLPVQSSFVQRFFGSVDVLEL